MRLLWRTSFPQPHTAYHFQLQNVIYGHNGFTNHVHEMMFHITFSGKSTGFLGTIMISDMEYLFVATDVRGLLNFCWFLWVTGL